ncbi:MAG: DUF4440 domain-containing protein [Acidobacteria bacterium]|nr:MAG: DUF4440 domain-containing protein [Acidobacteriota bacterium]REK01338.1 MAG: DUF4440 domain-containing protein [Acidobacteriota bacterium]REK14294.1 MAG: DUF4440 domain-containing protein [Acidobacteriota bacterium]REK45009.1 MAG: DUF4440 domain-containing protein [Acidobacteriota bacterium]
MKLIANIAFAAFVFASLGAFAAAQSAKGPDKARLILEDGVAPHSGVDSIYTRFSKAYDELDAKLVASLYTDDAAYLSPGSDIRIGNDKILESFSRSFASVKQRNLKWDISFRIVQREVGDELGFDVGIYSLTTTQPNGESRIDRGKFVVITKLGKDGIWRFQVDGYSDMPAQD